MTISNATTFRIWTTSIPVMLDGALFTVLAHQITCYRMGDRIIGAFVDDGQDTVQVSIERAAHLLTWAQAEGTLKLIASSEDEPIGNVLPIGPVLARQLHIDLGKLHIGGGHALASEVLGRRVTSLAALTLNEARELWSYAHACAELPTQPSTLFAVVA